MATRPSADVYIFFFNDTATTEIYTLSLHDALPISAASLLARDLANEPSNTATPEYLAEKACEIARRYLMEVTVLDRKSTRLNSSHANISYAVFCLKKKKNTLSFLSHVALTSLHLFL